MDSELERYFFDWKVAKKGLEGLMIVVLGGGRRDGRGGGELSFFIRRQAAAGTSSEIDSNFDPPGSFNVMEENWKGFVGLRLNDLKLNQKKLEGRHCQTLVPL